MHIPALPPYQLQHAWQCAARCDAVVTPQDGSAAYSYERHGPGAVAMAKYDNGAGAHIVAFFGPDGRTVLKGFDHESAVSPHAREEYAVWPGLYEGMPPDLLRLIHGEAVEPEHVTFCCWSVDGLSWQTGNAHIPADIDDGSGWLLRMVQMNAQEFIAWATSYYGDHFRRIGERGVLAEFGRDRT